MVIPEELLKLSDKELHKILNVKNSYAARYLFDYNNNIYRVKKKLSNFGIVVNTTDNKISSINLNSYNILTYDILNEFKKANLEDYLHTCTDEVFSKYLKLNISQILNESEYDIQINDDYVDLIVHYPEITITNSVELSHIIRDIYIKYEFKYNTKYKKRYCNISIGRTTYTIEEWLSNYKFSHTTTGNLKEYTAKLCFGNTELNEAVISLSSGLLKMLQTVILSFKEYLSWESLEGTPYIYISNIKDIGKYILFPTYLNSIEHAYIKLLYNITDLQYTYDLINGNYVIKLAQSTKIQIEEWLNNNISNASYFRINGLSYTNNSTYTNLDLSELNRTCTEINFKNEYKVLKIIDSQADTIIPEKRVHINLVNKIVSRLEDEFTNYLIQEKLNETINQ